MACVTFLPSFYFRQNLDLNDYDETRPVTLEKRLRHPLIWLQRLKRYGRFGYGNHLSPLRLWSGVQCLIECNSICQNLIMPIKARPSSQYYLPVKCYWKICSLTAIGSVWPWRIQFVLVKDRVADRVSERAKSLTKLYCRGHSARRKARLVVATARKRG